MQHATTRSALVVALAALWCATPALARHARPFGPPKPVVGPPSDTPATAEGTVDADLSVIPDASSVEVPLPDGGVVVADRTGFEYRDPASYLWKGKLVDVDGDVLLTVKDGAIAGSITSRDGTYLIRDRGKHGIRILKVDETKLPPEAESLPAVAAEASDTGAATGPAVAAEGGPTLDVVIVYTPEARAAAGGTAAMAVAIQNAVDWTNGAYENSLMSPRQRLVHTQEVSYAEATHCRACPTCTRDMGCDLEWLQRETAGTDADGDGTTYMDDLRNQYGADLVALIVTSGNYCGIAYVMQSVGSAFAPWAVSVTLRSCFPSTYAHETGHNLGCMHDPDNASGTGAYDYSFGHRHCVAGGFRTVMSYQCATNQPQVSRIQYFSNPNVSYNNGGGLLATGQWAGNCNTFGACRDCAQTIENTGSTAADWRASVTPSPTPVTACASPGTIAPEGGTVTGTTSGANTLNPSPGCAYGDNSTAPEEVYAWTPSTSGAWTVETCGSSLDTVLYVRSGDCVGGPAVACNDDACGLQSRVTVNATAGTTYYIVVDGFAFHSGAFTLSVVLAPPTHTPTVTSTATITPTPTVTPTATDSPTITPTPLPTDTPTVTPTPTSTATPTPTPQVFRFEAAQDSWIDQGKPTQNKGTDTSLRVKAQSGSVRRSLVQFGLSGIPVAGCIQTATLKMTLTNVGRSSRTYAVHALRLPWIEGTGSSSSGVTWQRRTGTTTWSPGGDFVATATATAPTGTTSGSIVQWNVRADVQAFVGETLANYGWVVKDTAESANAEFVFASSENGTASRRPQLEVIVVPGSCPTPTASPLP